MEQSSIRMYQSFKLIDLANPEPEHIEIRDIARGLSQINRFTGHTIRPYSVAEHCVLMSYCVPMCYALDALMHDASEAYLGDVSSPLKTLLPEYKLLEARWIEAIYQAFGLTPLGWHAAEVKAADHLALQVELDVLVARGQDQPDVPPKNYMKMRHSIERNARIAAVEAEKQFTERFYHLVAELHLGKVEKARAA